VKDTVLFIRIACLVLVTPFLVRIKSLPELCDYFTPKNTNGNYRKEKIIKYTDFLVGWQIPIFTHYCLVRSLILYKLLRENGTNVVINFGVLKDRMNKIGGHSWLTLNGKIYLEDERTIEKFIKIDYTFPRSMK